MTQGSGVLTDAMLSRIAWGGLLALAACGGDDRAAAWPRPAERCGDAELLAFDPGLRVVERSPLPPMAHVGGEQTQNLARLPCREAETDDACARRAREEAEEAFPEATAIDVDVVADELRLVVRYREGEEEKEERFASVEEAREAFAERAAGGPVVIDGIEPEPVPDTGWSAAIAVTMPEIVHRLDIRRVWLRFVPGPDPLADLALLQRRAEAEGYFLDTWRRLDDASIQIEVRCLRPAS